MRRFHDRVDAGRKLADALAEWGLEQPIVVALPRGGVPVGYEVARALGAPLEIWVVRKIGVPGHEELGMGAVAEGGYVGHSTQVVQHVGVTQDVLREVTDQKRREVYERVRRFRGERPALPLKGQVVVLVDDGVATGATIRVAARSIRAQAPDKLILAVPVAASDTLPTLAPLFDEVVCLIKPANLIAIGLWYDDFRQVTDDEVVRLLERSRTGPVPRQRARTAHL